MPDSQVTEYISAAIESNFQVILDIQIGALTPAAVLEFGWPWLKYENVHLALDPEFALVYPGQTVPGNPGWLCHCRADQRGAGDHAALYSKESD